MAFNMADRWFRRAPGLKLLPLCLLTVSTLMAAALAQPGGIRRRTRGNQTSIGVYRIGDWHSPQTGEKLKAFFCQWLPKVKTAATFFTTIRPPIRMVSLSMVTFPARDFRFSIFAGNAPAIAEFIENRPHCKTERPKRKQSKHC